MRLKLRYDQFIPCILLLFLISGCEEEDDTGVFEPEKTTTVIADELDVVLNTNGSPFIRRMTIGGAVLVDSSKNFITPTRLQLVLVGVTNSFDDNGHEADLLTSMEGKEQGDFQNTYALADGQIVLNANRDNDRMPTFRLPFTDANAQRIDQMAFELDQAVVTIRVEGGAPLKQPEILFYIEELSTGAADSHDVNIYRPQTSISGNGLRLIN